MCTTIQAACTGTNAQYASMDTCVASCAHFPAGASGAMSGNSLACREYHAMAAQTDPTTHCVHAGPSGGGVCGMPCDGFCSLVVAECPAQYASATDCMTTCGGYIATPSYNATVTTGNSLSCRIFHATEAAMDPATHCSHTAMASPVCQ
jgi:hypothetical protein